jgi:hypothetical protein
METFEHENWKAEASRRLSIGGRRLQESNQLGAVLGRREPTIPLHAVAGDNLIGFRDEAVDSLSQTKSAPFIALE